jgi:hypothetical protein
MDWRLYYEDGSVYEPEQGAPHESPGWGLVLVLQVGEHVDHHDQLLVNKDFYCWRTDLRQWLEHDRDGLLDQLVTRAHEIGAVRPGRTLPTDRFRAIWERALADRQTLCEGCD